MKKSLLLGFLLIFNGSPSAFAGRLQLDAKFWNQVQLQQATESPEMKELAQAIPQRLIDQGIGQLGQVNMKRFLKDLNDTTFRENTSFVPTQAGSRTSGMYDPKSKTLVINTSTHPVLAFASKSDDDQKFRRERLEPTLLHESYGAHGIDDRKYDKSLGATILADPPKRLSEEEKLELKRRIHQRLQKSGGTTTVGGGGDDISLWIKLKALQQALSLGDGFRLFELILDMNIEMDPSCDFEVISFIPVRNEIRFCLSSFWLDLANEKDQLVEINRFVQNLSQETAKTGQP